MERLTSSMHHSLVFPILPLLPTTNPVTPSHVTDSFLPICPALSLLRVFTYAIPVPSERKHIFQYSACQIPTHPSRFNSISMYSVKWRLHVISSHKLVEPPIAVWWFLFDNLNDLFWSAVYMYITLHTHTHPLVCIPLGLRITFFHIVYLVSNRIRLAVALSDVNFQIRSEIHTCSQNQVSK